MSDCSAPAVRVQNIIAEILPDIAMEAVGSRLDGGVDDAALKIAELGGALLVIRLNSSIASGAGV